MKMQVSFCAYPERISLNIYCRNTFREEFVDKKNLGFSFVFLQPYGIRHK